MIDDPTAVETDETLAASEERQPDEDQGEREPQPDVTSPALDDAPINAEEEAVDEVESPIEVQPVAYSLFDDMAVADAVERACLIFELGQTEARRDAITKALAREQNPVPPELRETLEARRQVMQERCMDITERLWPLPVEDEPEPGNEEPESE